MDTESPTSLADAIALTGLLDEKPRNRHEKRTRPKIIGHRFGRALDRNEKNRIAVYARWYRRHHQDDPSKPQLTRVVMDVLRALLWRFHNEHTGALFPRYEAIADEAMCARSMVAEAIKTLERASILTWVNCIKRVRQPYIDLFGNQRVRIVPERTSNAYAFGKPPNSPKSGYRTGTSVQGISTSSIIPEKPKTLWDPDVLEAVARLASHVIHRQNE